eukprot:3131109-Rhodomonas_salina.1
MHEYAEWQHKNREYAECLYVIYANTARGSAHLERERQRLSDPFAPQTFRSAPKYSTVKPKCFTQRPQNGHRRRKSPKIRGVAAKHLKKSSNHAKSKEATQTWEDMLGQYRTPRSGSVGAYARSVSDIAKPGHRGIALTYAICQHQ